MASSRFPMIINGAFIGAVSGGLVGYALFGRWLGQWLGLSVLLGGSSTPPLDADSTETVSYVLACEAIDGRRSAFLAMMIAGCIIGAFVCWLRKRAAQV